MGQPTWIPFLFIVFIFVQPSLPANRRTISVTDTCFKENTVTWTCNFIPTAVPTGFPRIKLQNFMRDDTVVDFNDRSFSNRSWDSVQSIEFTDGEANDIERHHGEIWFQSRCFSRLKHLLELHIHMNNYWFQNDTMFGGLSFLEVLDFSDSHRFSPESFISVMKSLTNFPNLKQLIIRGMGRITGKIHLNTEFFETIATRNITHLDVGYLQIAELNLSAFFEKMILLQSINASRADIDDLLGRKEVASLNNLKYVDFSRLTLPSHVTTAIPGPKVVTDSVFKRSNVKEAVRKIFLIEVINATEALNQKKTGTYSLHNCTAIIDVDPKTKTVEVVLRENGLKYMDINMICDDFKVTSLRRVDLGDNGMEFINPSIPSCFPNLEDLDLSENHLYKMISEKPEASNRLFTNVSELRRLFLSNNILTHVPVNWFSNNSKLELIDLSGNKLTQIHFSLHNLHHLKVLDLRDNQIHYLDKTSVEFLNTIRVTSDDTDLDTRVIVMVENNPLKCSSCDADSFVTCFLYSKYVRFIPSDITCTSFWGGQLSIDRHLHRHISIMCKLWRYCLCLITLAGLCTSAYLDADAIEKGRKLERLLFNLKKGTLKNRHVALVLASEEYEGFVLETLNRKLETALRLHANVNRQLPMVFSETVKKGEPILNNFIRYLDESLVLIIYIADDCCRREACLHPFFIDVAKYQENPKPIIFIKNDQVSTDILSYLVKTVCEISYNITLKEEHGNIVFEPSMEENCKYIFDAMAHHFCQKSK